MKIIWLAPECPYPPNSGGRKVVWNRILHMSQNNDIYLYCIYDKQDEVDYERDIRKVCKEVALYDRKTGIASKIKSLLYPYPAVSRWNKNMKKDIEEASKRIQPDIIMVEFPQMVGCLPKGILEEYTVVLNQHNIEYVTLKNLAQNNTNWFGRLLYKVVAKQMYIYEKQIYKKGLIDLYTFLSSDDISYFEKKFHLQNVLYVPAGADIHKIRPIVNTPKIVFIAQFSYSANDAAAKWFVKNCWNKVRSSIKDANLYLVGKNPTESLRQVCVKYSDIVITGTVDSVEDYYEMCDLVIVPITTGGGVKIKLLEALGHGKIVVTTKESLIGTDFVMGEHLLGAETADEFADLCIQVLKNPYEFEGIRQAGYKKMKDSYSWEKIMLNCEEALLKICTKVGYEYKKNRY